MFDMSWGEMLIIGAVALIVIGPKDLPKALRTVGNMVGKVRRMAGEFQGQFQDAMREAEMDEVRRNLDGLNKSVSSFDPVATIRDEIKSAVDKPAPEASVSPAAVAAATEPAATLASADPVLPAAVTAPDVTVPLPEPAPVDIARDFAPPAPVEAAPLPQPALETVPDAEPRRAKA
jgi:sec-independent protein translocase protein TatB